MSFDDTRYARMMDPPLTTVRQPMKNLRTTTVYLLLCVLEGDHREITPESGSINCCTG